MIAADYKLYGWHLELGKVDYDRTLAWQHGLVKMRKQGFARDTIITVEHPPVLTVGKDGHKENFAGLPEPPIQVERGGDVTFHGPGQLVAYFIFNLARRGRDLHAFMAGIQQGVIDTLAAYGIEAAPGEEYIGIWVGKKKIGSIGVAVKNWITYHGIAINLNTDLSEFKRINPCGLEPETMISVEQIIGKKVELSEFSAKLIDNYSRVFETGFAPVDLESLAEDVESQAGGYEI